MVKKLQKMAAKKGSPADNATSLPVGLLDSQFSQSVKDSAQHIWAAGLGAFSKAQGEGGKVFEALVKEGMTLQKKTQSAAEEKLGAMASKMSGMAGDVGNKAGQHWDKLESIFEERVAQALKRLGVPSAKDVAALTARIDALSLAAGIKPPAKKGGKAAADKTATAKADAPKAAVPKAEAAPAPVPVPAKRAAKRAAPSTAATTPKAAAKSAAKTSGATPEIPAVAAVFELAAKPAAKRVVKKKAAVSTATTTAAASADASGAQA